MINQFTNIKKIFFLGIAVASTKVILLLFAYFFDAETYNRFNQVYYTTSIIILFGSLGFNIAVTRISITWKNVLLAVTANTMMVYIVLHLISAPFNNPLEIASIVIYGVFISVSGIFIFQLLFEGRYKIYVLLTLLYSALHIMLIPSVLFFNIDFFISLPVIGVLWFIIGLPGYIKTKDLSQRNFKKFYKIGVSAFVINSAVSLALAADKYFVNHFFSLELANSYTFAWSLTAPMFYIGVIIERFLFSETRPSKSNILKKGFSLSASLVVIYSFVILLAVNFVPGLIPVSLNYTYVNNILTLMITGYSLYVIFHFPINAYLFKSLETEKQKTISIIFSIIISVFVVVYIIIMQGFFEINYIWLLFITWSNIFTLLIAKVIIMFRTDSVEEAIETIFEIKNLEP